MNILLVGKASYKKNCGKPRWRLMLKITNAFNMARKECVHKNSLINGR